jgi:long-chain acyl-CoA synthetase
MNEAAHIWPAMTLAEAGARLTAPGQPFETVDAVIRGVPMKVWKNVPVTARAVFEQACRHGGREFLIYEDERITFDAFARAVRAVAAALRREGLARGDRVALVMRNLPEWPVVFFSVLLAGGIAVPLNAWWTGAELAHGLKDSGSRFVFADPERLERLKDNLPPSVQKLFVTRAPFRPAGMAVLEDILGPPGQWSALPEGAMPDVALDAEDDATIFYTSGTTGSPKGAVGTHRALTTNIFATPFSMARNALRRGLSPPDLRHAPQRVALIAVPFFHVTGSIAALLPNMVAGSKLVLMRKFEPEAALALIQKEGVTVTGGVPAIALAMLEHPRFGEFDLSSLQMINYGGAPSPATLAARIRTNFPHAAPGNGWGMTETSATCTTHFGEEYDHRPASCGPALPVSRIRIMDSTGTQELPRGQVGELWAFGPNLVRGYWNRPQDTDAVFRDGWLRTGDLASMDEEGFCFIVDRVRDMLIRGGENIYCCEVESVLCEHPAIADAALVGLSHPLLGEVPAAIVQVRAPVSESDLKVFVADRLASFKVPDRILLSPKPLPRNTTGKLVKAALKALYFP